MARAIIPTFVENFGQPDISDDNTNGWRAKFQVFYLGAGASNGFMVDQFEAHFGDADTPQTMETKMRDAARDRAVELGIAGATTLTVTSMIAPKKL